MQLDIRHARMEDYEAVCRFYEEVIRADENKEFGPAWHVGIYPSAEDLRGHIEDGELVIGLCGERLASAMVLAGREDEIYAAVPWTIHAPEDRIAVLHLFAVHPDFRGKGVSGQMMDAMFGMARAAEKLLIHLDVVKGNLPAEKLYRRIGFRFVCETDVYYEDTGDLRVVLYEYDLTEREQADA